MPGEKLISNFYIVFNGVEITPCLNLKILKCNVQNNEKKV